MTIELKNFIQLMEPYAYYIVQEGPMFFLAARDGRHTVLLTKNESSARRWKPDLNKAFERGVRIGLSMGSLCIAETGDNR